MKRILKIFIGIALFTCSTYQLKAQELSNEHKEVYDVIVKLFDGMRAGDSSMVHSVFSDDVRMYSNFMTKKGENITNPGKLQNFLQAVGTPHEEIWDERIWDVKIDVDLGVAQVWCEYAFYAGDRFSHCGIDAFQMIKGDSWKIIQLIDTRKKEACELPESIKTK